MLPHWTWDGNHTSGLMKTVRAYTNAASVSLTLNGKAVGKKKTVRKLGWAEWNVTYVPGTLSAKGYDASGKVIATDLVQTAGKPARLRLSIERGIGESEVLDADGIDVGILRVEVQDSEGLTVPTSSITVSYKVVGAGQLHGLASGNPSDLTPDKSNARQVFGGLGRVIVQTIAGRAGKLEVHAEAKGLLGDVAVLDVQLPAV